MSVASLRRAPASSLADQKARPVALLKAGMLATAFLFWAANQLWPDRPQATLFNAVAVALFVVDVLFSILVE